MKRLIAVTPRWLKQLVKFIFYYKNKIQFSHFNRDVVELKLAYKNVTSGYYDQNIFVSDREIVLFATDADSTNYPRGFPGYLLIYDLSKSEYKVIQSIKGWSWQQANLFQVKENMIFYNSYSDDRYRGFIREISVESVKELQHPVVALHASRSIYVSIDMVGLIEYNKDYGIDVEKSTFAETDLMYICDYDLNETVLTLKKERVKNFLGLNCDFWINHPKFIEDKVIFVVRFNQNKQRITKTILWSLKDDELTLLDFDFMSHYGVRFDGSLLAYGTHFGDSRDWLFNPSNNGITEGCLEEFTDFHVTERKRDLIYFDNYPSTNGVSEVKLMIGSKKELIARYFHNPKHFGFCRIDHHVKCNDTGSVVIFDIPKGNGRGVAIWNNNLL